METKDIFGSSAKTTAKKSSCGTAKKSVKKELKKDVFIQYHDRQVDEKAVIKKVEDDLKSLKIKADNIKLYIKPEENACYYVANDTYSGKVELF